MTPALWLRRAGRLGIALLIGLVLAPAGRAGAAGTECWGTWRLELAAPSPDREAWLSPDSWCRGARLPRTLAVEARRGDDGRAILTGTPLRPTDLVVGSGRCEFQFTEATGGPPKNHELSVDVNASGTIIQGTAKCSERTLVSEGKTTAISIGVAVKGSRSPAVDGAVPAPPVPAAAPGPERLVAAVVAACREGDGEALWKMLTPRFRSELDRRAAQVRRSVPVSDLRSLFGHSGRPADFKGLAFLRHAVRADDSSINPCSGAERWEVGAGVASPGGFLVPVTSTKDTAFGLRLTPSDRGWQLDQITKQVRAR